jgi:signal peptidase II
MLFSASPEGVPIAAEFMPAGGGYAGFLHGRVVICFTFPLFTIEHVPDWVPFIGGERFTFFNAIFNVADAAITTGIFMILFFQKRYFKKMQEAEKRQFRLLHLRLTVHTGG